MELVLAYIDPGSGSLVIQALIAGLVAAPIFFRKQISRFVNTVRGGDTATATESNASTSAKTDDTPQGG